MPRLPRVVELRQVSQFLSGGVQGWVPLMGDTEQVFTNVVDFLAQTQEERSIWQLGLSESATKRCVSLQELSGQPAFDLWPRTPPWILSYCRNSFARPSKTSSLSALCSMIFCTCSTKRTWKSRKLDAWVLEIPFGKPFVQPIDLRQPYYTYIYIYYIYTIYIYTIYCIHIYIYAWLYAREWIFLPIFVDQLPHCFSHNLAKKPQPWAMLRFRRSTASRGGMPFTIGPLRSYSARKRVTSCAGCARNSRRLSPRITIFTREHGDSPGWNMDGMGYLIFRAI